MKQNQVIRQELTVSKRTLKHISRRGEYGKLSRPTYTLVIKSWHGSDMDSSKYAVIAMEIPKGTAEALVQDHGATWDTTVLGSMG